MFIYNSFTRYEDSRKLGKIITLLEEIKLANQQINFSKEILSAQDVSNELPDL